MKSLLSVATSSSSLSLNWKDNSGCATQLTSFNLKTFLVGLQLTETQFFIFNHIITLNLYQGWKSECYRRSWTRTWSFPALVWTNRGMKRICSHLLYLPITHARWNGRRWTLVGSTHLKWNQSIPRLGVARHIFGRHSRPNKVLFHKCLFYKE
jgi:hypothetical protein